MTTVAILGSGPSGLVAAWAAVQYGGNVQIFSPLKKSTIWGAQYLHQPIPGISTDAPEIIRYTMTGRPEDYLLKVYGDDWDGHISDDLRDQAHCAWDMRATYEKLWDYFLPKMTQWVVGPSRGVNLRNYKDLVEQFDIVVNTIPRQKFCQNGHKFKDTKIWAMGDSDQQLVPVHMAEGIVEYNGTEDKTWYRAARIFGYSTVEWPWCIGRPPIPGTALVSKPISHNCDCIPKINHIGRNGRWDKNKLAHHAYADMIELMMIEEENNEDRS